MSSSLLDANQVIKAVYDSANSALQVNVVAGGGGGGSSTKIEDGAGSGDKATVTVALALKVDGSAVTQPVSASSLPLPSGAATSAAQTTGNTSLASIDSKLTAPLSVTGPLTDTQLRASAVPVSAASLPLPSGAATSANQSTEIASLSSIDSKIPASLTVSSTRLLVDGSGVTQPVSATSLPLPTGAATSANQSTEID